jgi:hypothetical protein
MGAKAARIETALTVKECAALFQTSPKRLMSGAAKFQGATARLAGGNFTAGFFTPAGPTVSADRGDDAPEFAVGTFIRNGISAANPTELHMYVWDRGSQREVMLVAGHGLMTGAVHARKLVQNLAQLFAARDRAATVRVDF